MLASFNKTKSSLGPKGPWVLVGMRRIGYGLRGICAWFALLTIPARRKTSRRSFRADRGGPSGHRGSNMAEIAVIKTCFSRQPRPFDHALALLINCSHVPRLLEKATTFSAGRHVGHDEADARIQFARMPLDFGDDAAGLRPAPPASAAPPAAGASHRGRYGYDRGRGLLILA
jgi:hypothetical protein